MKTIDDGHHGKSRSAKFSLDFLQINSKWSEKCKKYGTGDAEFSPTAAFDSYKRWHAIYRILEIGLPTQPHHEETSHLAQQPIFRDQTGIDIRICYVNTHEIGCCVCV